MDLINVKAEHDVRNWALSEDGGVVTGFNTVTKSEFTGTMDEFNLYIGVQPELNAQGFVPEFDRITAKLNGYSLGDKQVIVISSEEPDNNDGRPNGTIYFKIA